MTNGTPDLQRAKLSASNLAPYFAAVVVSGEIGAGKPDPRPFAAALTALDIAPTRAVVVGDSPERDIAGARSAGLRAILIDRAGRVPVAAGDPTPVIRNLGQLAALL